MRYAKSIKYAICILVICVIIGYLHISAFSNAAKILLIGLDGATWAVIDPLIKDGSLPNIKKLMDRGSWGRMESVYPMKSELIWTTFATGKTMKEHGIIDRLAKDPNTGELVPVTSNLRKVKAIWNILSEYKKKVCVAGYLVTWPVEKINGVMISNRAKPDMDYLSVDYSYPPFTKILDESKFKEINNSGNDIALKIFSKSSSGGIANYLQDIGLNKTIIKDTLIFNYADYLLKKQAFDFSAVYITGIDALSHIFWKYLYPDGFDVSKEDVDKYKEVIPSYYRYCDRIIGKLISNIDRDTVIIVISDHGFTSKRTEKKEYLFDKLNAFLKDSGLAKINQDSGNITLTDISTDKWFSEKDISISPDHPCATEEFEVIRKKLKDTFNNIKTLETGRCIFKSTRDTERGFAINIDMAYVNSRPDDHILFNNKEYLISNFISEQPNSGTHEKYGIIIMAGKGIERNKKITSANSYDIMPTMLYILGLPVGRDMKGTILTEAITRLFQINHAVRYISTYETERQNAAQKPVRSPNDEKSIKQTMRSLGYIN